MRQRNHRPIGVFDSGVGGLTVVKALMESLPHESTVYLGDTARVPYGTKSAEVVTQYSLRNAALLIEQDIKLLVIACNTASAVALPRLAQNLDVPVVGVIEPGALAAAKLSTSGRIGVIGTPGTIRSGAYQRALERARPGVAVTVQSCPLFVPLAEEGWVDGEVPLLIARRYLAELASSGVDTLVLGCTHYPLLREVIRQVMGDETRLVDSAASTAEMVALLLRSSDQLAINREPIHRYLVTDSPGSFVAVAARFLGKPVLAAEQVDVPFEH